MILRNCLSQGGILSNANKKTNSSKSHDVFISFAGDDKTGDQKAAMMVCDYLESRGIKCWIYLRDERKGEEFEEAILNSIKNSKVLVLIYSNKSNSSHFVEKEIRHASLCRIPIIPFKLEDAPYNSVLDYYLTSHNWLDATTQPLENHLRKLAEDITQLITQEIAIPIHNTNDQKLVQRSLQSSSKEVKKPSYALFLSFLIVGSGQIYNGHIKKGFTLMSTTYVGSVLFFNLTMFLMDRGGYSEFLLLSIFIATPLFCWLYSMYDSYVTALNLNKNIIMDDWFSKIGNKKALFRIVSASIVVLLISFLVFNSTSLAWNYKGIKLDGDGRYNDAIQAYDKAIEINPTFSEAYCNKGETLYKMGRYKEAIQAYDSVLEIFPQYIDAWNEKGNALFQLGKYEEAIQAYETAIRYDPMNSNSWNNKGYVLNTSAKYEEALQAYDKAIEYNPQNAIAWYNRGSTLNVLGKQEEATKSLNKAIELGYTPSKS